MVYDRILDSWKLHISKVSIFVRKGASWDAQNMRILELERAARDGDKVVSHLGIILKNANTNCLNTLKSGFSVLGLVEAAVGTPTGTAITGTCRAPWLRPGPHHRPPPPCGLRRAEAQGAAYTLEPCEGDARL